MPTGRVPPDAEIVAVCLVVCSNGVGRTEMGYYGTVHYLICASITSNPPHYLVGKENAPAPQSRPTAPAVRPGEPPVLTPCPPLHFGRGGTTLALCFPSPEGRGDQRGEDPWMTLVPSSSLPAPPVSDPAPFFTVPGLSDVDSCFCPPLTFPRPRTNAAPEVLNLVSRSLYISDTRRIDARRPAFWWTPRRLFHGVPIRCASRETRRTGST